MFRNALGLALVGLLALPVSALADPQAPSPAKSSSSSSSTKKKVIWTIVGAGAGFALGTYIGFAKFDDATYAERKIWTTAIVGAAAGGVGGALIGRLNVGGNGQVERGATPARSDSLAISWESAVGKAPQRP